MTGGEALASHPYLYLLRPSHSRLHLNTFRGVRAISGFDWPFTPTLASSESFSTPRFRVCRGRLRRPLQARFHCGSAPLWRLASPATATRRLIMQKARRHRTDAAPTACRRMVSGSFSLLCPRFFSPFPHGTRPLSPVSAFRLRGSHPLRPAFPRRSATLPQAFFGRSYYPGGRVATPPVWAPPLSLATTRGITVVFFSCGY